MSEETLEDYGARIEREAAERADWRSAALALAACAEQLAVTSCREWVDKDEKYDHCHAPAEYVLWGKLIPAEGLGPRCYDCAAKHVGHHGLDDPQWAILQLKPTLAALARVRELERGGSDG